MASKPTVMSSQDIAFVVVTRDWFDATIPRLAGRSDSGSALNAHVIQAPLKDTSDPRGLWLHRIETDKFHKADGGSVVMDLLIPWQYVLAVGVVSGHTSDTLGFTGATVLKSADSEARSNRKDFEDFVSDS